MPFFSVKVLVLVTAFIIGPMGDLSAQAVAVTSVVGQSVPSRVITLDVSNVETRKVIESVAVQAGLDVALTTAVPELSKRISLHVEREPVQSVLRKIEAASKVRLEMSQDGKMLMVRRNPALAKGMINGVIAGKVTDSKTGKSISGANVSLGADMRGVVTDENGSYRLTGVANGTHTVSVRLVGYAKQTRSVTVGDGATVTANFNLEPSANVLNEVVVTGTIIATELKAVPSAITVVTAKEIEQRGITRIDQLFRGDIPGLFSLEMGGGSPTGGVISVDEVVMFSRGATNISTSSGDAKGITNPIKTYIDGVEMADPQYLNQIDPKSIERIEILTGPQASTIYGAGAINGVMQIFTKRGSTIKPSITFSFVEGIAQNNFNSSLSPSHELSGRVSGTEGKVSYSVGGGWDYTGAWTPGNQKQHTGVDAGARYQSGAVTVDLSGRRRWTYNKTLGSEVQTNTALTENGTFGVTSGGNGLQIPSRASLSGRTFSTTVTYAPFSWWSHQIMAGSDASDRETLRLAPSFISRSDTSTPNNNRTDDLRVSQSYSSTLRIPLFSIANATLTYGGDHWRKRLTSVAWRRYESGILEHSDNSRSGATTSKNTGAYVQGQFGFWDALFLTYGVRADWNPNLGEKAKTRPGRYGASYSRDFGIVSAKLRGSYGRSITPPAPEERDGSEVRPINTIQVANLLVFGVPGEPLVSRFSNPELGSEFQQGGEGGVELYFGSRASLVVTRYNQTVEGLIYLIPAVDSVRALVPGTYTGTGANNINCSTAALLRSDGYCYFGQDQNINAGSVRNQGWEMKGSMNMGPFTTGGTYSWNKSRVIGVTPRYRALLTDTEFTPGQSFDYVQEHTWALNMSYARQGTSVSLNVNGVGESLRGASNSELSVVTRALMRFWAQDSYRMGFTPSSLRLPIAGYTTAGLNASHRFTSKLDATLNITNLTNYYQNDFNYSYATAGRSSRLGLRWRL